MKPLLSRFLPCVQHTISMLDFQNVLLHRGILASDSALQVVLIIHILVTIQVYSLQKSLQEVQLHRMEDCGMSHWDALLLA